MHRKLILTPEDQAILAGSNYVIEFVLKQIEKNQGFNLTLLVLAALTTNGVDQIQSFSTKGEFDLPLIKKVISDKNKSRWSKCNKVILNSLKNATNEINDKSEEFKQQIFSLHSTLTKLLFALESRSSVIFMLGFKDVMQLNKLPFDLTYPIATFFENLEQRTVKLPRLTYDVENSDIISLLEILYSYEYSNYKSAHSEIENNLQLTDKIVKNIELAGNELFRKYQKRFIFQKGIINALPLSSKVIDLLFGKLPGDVTEYSGNALLNYLKKHKTVPIYNGDIILRDIIKRFKEHYKIYSEEDLKDMGYNLKKLKPDNGN
jgi:hypothetical protein